MKSFTSFAAMATEIGTMVAAEVEAEHRALARAAVLIEKRAKAKIGEYQDAAGDFVAWAELADATKEDRLRQGYTENDPLLREGTLQDSIEHQVQPNEAQIGSNMAIAEYQELGTNTIPPRSFLGSTGVESAEEVVKIIGEGVFIALTGGGVFGGAIPLLEKDKE